MPTLANSRHELFCQEIVKGQPVFEAFRAAGYTSVKSAASNLMAREDIQGRIAELQGKAAKKAELSLTRTLEEIGKVAFANMADYMRVGSDGDPYLDFSALTRDQAAALAEVTVEDFKEGRGEDARDIRRIKFKLASKLDGLDKLMRHFGAYKDRFEHSGPDGGPIEISDADLARQVAFLLTKAASE